jgi:uncharacterized protein with ParB-like and HNH nuclease domain
MNNIKVPTPKTIADLKDYKFYIPSYQHGYRWTSKDVEALLDDIYEFNAGTTENPKKFCLQPWLFANS